MKPKTQKKKELEQLKDKLPKTKITVFTSFSKAGEKGLSVSQMTELKRMLRLLNSEYVVAKKSLIDLAFKSINPSADGDRIDVFGMEGSIGLVMGDDDPYTVAKKLYEFSRKNQALRFFGAFVDESFIDVDKFMEMAKMPSREVLLGRLVGMLTYPIRGLAVAMNEISKKKAGV
ncbi:MAG: 50S ribosomal protein L10 [Candidatus Yanofskybacteria bacterium RIFCSPHIGHO2_01_FULL_42_12]|uniref:Large ribosomal subunit protein uL10 n=1 Tax=Candidatus Yanofskybacteria bacterium RIFCSPLOWO2_01_FULL_42_49 TaxID=1802694 RepID=A0A1F8GCN3_9BACT|nr:MAG: 50S ribosomal protein L10 [Candidatus Yanofskybacteria bacterium RIFCSPHIGHO2_01_FULL_42_12]OGN22508.1 MAG: 50S ribosomal protein L10 [Candidatus Yanofskybacteria bacterium RIFCSPLOWO2_01_FULL_42_49]